MSVVKDFLLLFLFLFIVIKYILLHKEFIRQKMYFINTLNHDLRISAIAQIRGIEILKKNIGENNEIINGIDESCRFLLEMINMLLNLYKYEKGSQFLKYEYFSPFNLIKQISKDFETRADEKGITFFYDIDKKIKIEAEKEAINRVLKTFLATAINHSYSNHLITIKLMKDSKKINFTITYCGKNLSDEEYARMFMGNPKFSTVGQGIKLHLAKKIIDFHQGQIKVKKIMKELTSLSFSIPIDSKNIKLKHNFIPSLNPNRL